MNVRKYFCAILLFCLPLSKGYCQVDTYEYQVDLTKVVKDRLLVELKCPLISEEATYFNFPKTIPGAYKTIDYGRFIGQFKALDKNGNELKTKKITTNTWQIFNAKQLSKITYWVDDTYDSKKKKNKIFQPQGTNIDFERNFVINGGGFFGYFKGKELLPFQLKFIKSPALYGLSALPNDIKQDFQNFKAKNYHHLIDCPIMFSAPDTLSFKVANTKVTLGVYSDNNQRFASLIYDGIKESMQAVEKFLPILPVSEYSFIIYIHDISDIGKLILNGKYNFFQQVKHGVWIKSLNYGALEHGNSSYYYLLELGDSSSIGMVQRVAIHEFMHILTPLNLHSEKIGNFNYVEPTMSSHLWLYEGVTEYFSGLIELKAGIKSPLDFINDFAKNKIIDGERFPNHISFAEMSEKVLDPKYTKLYEHVYDRGAILAMLLDFEIMRLTNGEKDLIKVLLALSKKYGQDKSFNENTFVDEFIAESHPDIKPFFQKYIFGKNDPNIEQGFKTIGIKYNKSTTQKVPINILDNNENGVKATKPESGSTVKILSVSGKDIVGFKKGDKTTYEDVEKAFRPAGLKYVNEGEPIHLKVIRNNQEELLTFTAKFKSATSKHVFQQELSPTPQQERLYNRWTSNSTNK